MPTALALPRYEPQHEYPVYPDRTESASPQPENHAGRSAGAARRAEARARRRALTHRPFHFSLFGLFAIALLSCQLLLLLWLTGSALNASRKERDIAKEIIATREDIFRTSEHISNYNSMPQIEQLATTDGMRRAAENDFDNFTDKSRWSPSAADKLPSDARAYMPTSPVQPAAPAALAAPAPQATSVRPVAPAHPAISMRPGKAHNAALSGTAARRSHIVRHPANEDGTTRDDSVAAPRSHGDDDSASLPDPGDAADASDADSGTSAHHKSNNTSDREDHPVRAGR